MGEENTNVKDILIALYTQNEQYHDSKEKAIWLAASVYLGFSVAVMVWLLDNKSIWLGGKGVQKCILIFFFTLLFIPTSVFIERQNWEKCKSVRKTDLFNHLIKMLGRRKNKELAYKDLVRLTDPGKLPYWYNLFHRGWPGAIILFVVVLFYVWQIVLLCLLLG